MEYIIDAKNKKLGRLATEIAVLLQGKQSATYEPRKPGDVKVIVKNASAVTVSGRKEKQKIYYHHTGYVGNLKKTRYEELAVKKPGESIRKAVWGMLPKNRLRAVRLKQLIIEK